jgi:hypothetical protein
MIRYVRFLETRLIRLCKSTFRKGTFVQNVYQLILIFLVFGFFILLLPVLRMNW